LPIRPSLPPRDWFQRHRGVKEPNLRQYVRGAVELLQALGEDVGQWTAQAVRNFLLERASRCGAPTTQKLITSLRAFLRYLNFRGESRDDLALAIPAVAHWRLSRLPQCLSAEDVERLIAACDGPHLGRLRDRAIVLMLARLGLRSGDVAHLRLADIDWGQRHPEGNGEKGDTRCDCRFRRMSATRCSATWNAAPRPSIPITCLFEATLHAGRLPPGMVSRL